MKRILTIICCLTLLLGIVPFCVSASETASQNMQTVEYLEDGSYIVTELEVTPAVARIHLLHGKQYSGFCSLVDW